MTKNDLVGYWKTNAERNLKEAKELCKAGKYHWALFVGQLALEKLLKGMIIEKLNNAPPFTHDLVVLSAKAGIQIQEIQRNQLATISRFNIEARYDEVKNELYKRATKEYSTKWIGIIEDIFIWLKTQ